MVVKCVLCDSFCHYLQKGDFKFLNEMAKMDRFLPGSIISHSGATVDMIYWVGQEYIHTLMVFARNINRALMRLNSDQ